MGRGTLSLLALSGLLAASALALALRPSAAPAAVSLPPAPARASARPAVPAAPSARPDSPFDRLPPLELENQTSHQVATERLYDSNGKVDEGAAARLDAVLCDARDPKQPQTTRMNRRTLQLLFKAAYHFGLHRVEVVSAYRKPGRRREGLHGQGAAIDFRLPGLDAPALAAYLRRQPRTGVGVYTHPKTQYVHLDSREHSFHWLDASPPRRRWREKSIGAADLAERDRDYAPSQDLPEGLAR